jgi:enamine deaminase RidA (YjgF/YER057c/UK114 family)
MPRRLISSGSPFEKFAGYSRAVIDGDFAFIAGTTGYDYKSMTMPAGVTAQTRNCFATIQKVLSDVGFAMADIVRAVYYITDPKNADAVLAVCGETLGHIRPAATLLVVAGLYKPEDRSDGETPDLSRTGPKPCPLFLAYSRHGHVHRTCPLLAQSGHFCQDF